MLSSYLEAPLFKTESYHRGDKSQQDQAATETEMSLHAGMQAHSVSGHSQGDHDHISMKGRVSAETCHGEHQRTSRSSQGKSTGKQSGT